MRRVLLIISVMLLLGMNGGCGDLKDAADIKLEVIKKHTFYVQGNGETLSHNLNLEDDENYKKYKGKIRSIRIDYIRYAIERNAGGAGAGDFYAGHYGSAFAAAKKVAQTISFAAGEIRPETNVEWIDKAFLESLLSEGKLSLWAAGSGSGVDIVLSVEIKVVVIANPFE